MVVGAFYRLNLPLARRRIRTGHDPSICWELVDRAFRWRRSRLDFGVFDSGAAHNVVSTPNVVVHEVRDIDIQIGGVRLSPIVRIDHS